MRELENKINYIFNDSELLKIALTHRSYTKEVGLPRELCNERLEFLGDAVLETIVCEQLYTRVPKAEEGKMTKIKSNVVRTESLAEIARGLNLGDYLILGYGEKSVGGCDKEGILADAMESIIAAVFIDSDFYTAKKVVLNLFEEQIEKGIAGLLANDYKSVFQEIVQSQGSHKIEYMVTREEGKSHDKTFYVDLKLDGKVVGSGVGKSKKKAENEAAQIAVNSMTK